MARPYRRAIFELRAIFHKFYIIYECNEMIMGKYLNKKWIKEFTKLDLLINNK